MSLVVLVIVPGLVHGFLRKLRIRKEDVRISAEPADVFIATMIVGTLLKCQRTSAQGRTEVSRHEGCERKNKN
jgi:hypothetical protein